MKTIYAKNNVRSISRKTVSLILGLTLFFGSAKAQLNGYQYKEAISIQNNDTLEKTNYQVLININTQGLISNGKMDSTGKDIRFSKMCDGSDLFNYWIESGINTTNTAIWIQIDTLPASASKIVYMHYGNNNASAASNFANTFPNATIVTATTTLTGVNNYDWFEVPSSASVNIVPGSPLVINARKIKIAGTINGNGAGNQGGTADGNGIGKGYQSTGNSGTYGAGGAGYGGMGGNGGGGGSATPSNVGQPGIIYGSLSNDSIEMGSSGGKSVTSNGGVTTGAGGGAITLNADVIEISGSISANGTNGATSTLNGADGGGSGGGVLVKGNSVSFSGTISANGGNGQAGGYGGGGGGGGRVKLFSDASITNTGTISVSGGAPGSPNNETVPQTGGDPGTIYTGTYTSDVPTYTFLGDPTPSTPVISQNGINLMSSATTGNQWYDQNGIISGQTNQTYTTTSCDTFFVLVENMGCLSDTSNTIVPLPTVTANASPSTTICSGSSLTLTGGGASTYAWDNGVNDGVPFTPTATTTYTVTGTAANNCTNTASITITVNQLPTVTASASPGTVVCSGTSVTLTGNGATSYAWDNGVIDGVPFTPSATTTYTVTGTTNNCSNTDQITITVNPTPPTPTISQSGNTLSSSSTSGNQWYSQINGLIAGATNQTYMPTYCDSFFVIVTNANGCVSDASNLLFYCTTGINMDQSGFEFSVYPNPSHGQFTVQSDRIDDDTNLSIYNSVGKLVMNKTISNRSTKIDASYLKEGVYYLKLSNNKYTEMIKVVIH